MAKRGFEEYLRRMAMERIEGLAESLRGNEQYRAARARRKSPDEAEADEATGEVMVIEEEAIYIQGVRDGMALAKVAPERCRKQG